MIKILTLHLLLLTLVVVPVSSQTNLSDNPVVIRYGDIEMKRHQFELEFELLMVINALKNGVPVKDQQQIMTMQYQYLKQRANELVLLEEARRKGISVSDNDLADGLDSIMEDLGFSGYNQRNLSKLGIVDEQRIKTYVHDRISINNLITLIKSEMEGNDIEGIFQLLISQLFQNSGIQSYRENLRSPLSKRYK